MVPVELLLSLSSGEKWVGHVDDHTLISIMVLVLYIGWLVLSSNEL